ncbi:hypothetical protein [Streptosporangium sp. NPDC002524]|uniref:hypothetical protein n=1 Tax=Streptosporangium sp. NPDC002524 TaxID=3154537 RepID=UPI00331F393F
MNAAIRDLVIEQGATYEDPLCISDEGGPVDLTGYSAHMQIRPTPDSATLLHDMSTTNGGILIDGPASMVTLFIDAAVTATFTWQRGVYDLELTEPSAKIRRLFKGTVLVDPQVTRP